jgi:hypothetical protein
MVCVDSISRDRGFEAQLVASASMLPHIRPLAALIGLTGTLALLASVAGPTPGAAPGVPESQAVTAPDLEKEARAVCGGCHAFPPPEILPRDAWYDALVRMNYIRENRPPPVDAPRPGSRDVLLPPDMARVLQFYTARAPERLSAPEPWPDPGKASIRFERRSLPMRESPGTPAVSSLQFVDLDGDGRLDLLGTDMQQGLVFHASPARTATTLSVLAEVPYPSRVRVADLNGDGLRDLLVGGLGEFAPGDHAKGAVIWLPGRGGHKFGAFWFDGWPRVADVQAADFNGDGRLDLAVAAFGWRKTGRLAILDNHRGDWSKPDFRIHTVDPRTGGIQMIPADLNGDGRMDFVALLAQEHETVIAYINTSGFSFERRVIYAAPHPNWGSSGIQLVDLDGDGDHDVLLAHGDTFDDFIVKPYHGIQWLENRGDYPYVAHTLAAIPGVHGIRAADLDRDGDLDIAAGALLAGGADMNQAVLPALVWLEQVKPGAFARHTIAMGFPRHAALDVGDVDSDGDLDIAVGYFFMSSKPSDEWVDVWINQLARRSR